MRGGGQFELGSVRRFFVPGESASALYAVSADRPSWRSVLELARLGSPVRVLCSVADCAHFRQLAGDTPNLSVTEVPDGTVHFAGAALSHPYDLLIIDEYGWQRDLLRDTLAAGAQPAVIVARDGSEGLEARQAKYALLIQMDYHFAGLSGEFSIWTFEKQQAVNGSDIGSIPLADLPAALKPLPVKDIPGGVQLDRGRAGPGDVRPIPARGDFEISGWAMTAVGEWPAADIFARARHEETGAEEYLRLPREARPDVVSHFDSPQMLMTGFRADLSPLCHRMGIHEVSVVQSDGACLYESGPLFRFRITYQEYELSARAGLANRYIRGSGIEIGALQKPAKLDHSVQVRYIDRMTLPKLLEHYPEMAAIPVQAPDIVDDGQSLHHIAEDSQDFAIANHFLEHCPDPIRSIHNMLRVVKQGGILYLAVPDKRHTFDLRRPVTPYAALKKAYLSGQRSGCAELFYEWAHLVYRLPPWQAKERAEQLMKEDYSIHYNVWATGDLLNFLLTARQDFQIPFELVAVVSSDNETIVLLERTAGRLPI